VKAFLCHSWCTLDYGLVQFSIHKVSEVGYGALQLLQGRKVYYVPGWDCHGLPIELKVLQSMDADARKELTPIKLRKKAAQFALKTVNEQRKSFKVP
jgi:isoleucyl-tRNA synthetase